ncbi:MAG: TspO/MBR family protein [Promethearchaeota archaeon]
MTGLDAFEATTLFFFLVAWWVNPFDTNGTSSKVMRKRYRNFKTYTKFLPGWIFGPVWFLLYTIMAISMWLYFNYANTEKHDEHHHYYDAMLGLMLIHYILTKLWTMLFFTIQNYTLGAIGGILIFLTAAILEILVWIHNNGDHQGKIYTAGALLIPYVIWSFYTMVLSIDIAINNTSVSFFGLTREMVIIHEGDDIIEEDSSVPNTEHSTTVTSASKVHSQGERTYRPSGKQRKRRQNRSRIPTRHEQRTRSNLYTANGWK